jgi:hypothetical protein
MNLVEARLSRFLPESELSQLNARTGETVPVSSMLWEVIGCALQISCNTGGLYDPTILDVLETAGYDRTCQAPWLAVTRAGVTSALIPTCNGSRCRPECASI